MTLSNLGAHRAAAAFVVTLATCPHALSSQADPAAPPVEIARRYDLRPAVSVGAPPPPGVIMDLHVSTAAIDALEPDGYDVALGPETKLVAKDCLRAVEFAVASASGATESELDQDGRWLYLTGTEAAHRAAAAALHQLEALNLDSVDVEVLTVSRAGHEIESAGWLSAEATSALLTAAEHHRSLLPVRIGRQATLNQTQTRSFLYDYDVEIAQGAVVADPVVSILRTGTHIGVRVDRAANGTGFIVRTWGRTGREAAPMRIVKLPVMGNTPIELPSVRSSIWTSSARLAPGEAMVVDAGTDELMLLRVLPSTGSTSMPPVSLGAYALQPMRPNLVSLPRTQPSQGFSDPRGSIDDFGPKGLTALPDQKELLARLGLSNIHTVGTHLICPDGSSSAQQAAAAIQALSKGQPVVNYAIEVRYRVLDAAQATAIRTEPDWRAFAADPSTQSLSSTTIGDDATLLVNGVESAYLADFDTQVAGGAVGPDPIVSTRFQGASIWCAPMKSSSGALRAWFDVQFQEERELPRTVNTVSYHPAPSSGNANDPRFQGDMRLDLPIELSTTESAGGVCLARLTDGAWGHVLTQPIGPDGRELLVIAKITTR